MSWNRSRTELPATTRRAVVRTAGALTGSVVAAACSPFGGSAPPKQDLAPVTLELWGFDLGAHTRAFDRIIQDWEATNPKEKVVPAWFNPYQVKIDPAVAAGSPPDVASELGRNVWARQAKKFYQPVDDAFRAAKVDPKKTFFHSALTPWEFLGKMYGVPIEDGSTGYGMVYRADIFQQAGVPLPKEPFKSYDEAYDIGRRLVRKQGTETVRGAWSTHNGWLMLFLFGAMLEAGQPYFDTKTRKYQVNTPAGVQAIEKIMVEPFRLGLELPGVPLNGSDKLAIASDGSLAMAMTNGPGIVRSAAQLDTAQQVKWLPRPHYKGSKYYFVGESGWGIVAFNEGKQRDRVGPFMVHAARPAAQQHWLEERACAPGGTPASREAPLCKGPEFADQRLVLSWQKFDETWRYFGPMEYGDMNKAFGAVLRARTKILKGEIGAKQAAQEITEELDRDLQTFYDTMRSAGVSI